METYTQYQAAQFKAVMLLKKYNFGAASTAKYLGKSRGLIQSWMQIGNKHHLASQQIKFKSFRKILKELRRNITREHLDYFIAQRLLDLKLPAAFISKILEVPTSTVRSWRHGKVPVEVKKFFFDEKLVDREFRKLMKSLKTDITNRNLEYFQALNLAKIARGNIGRRRIGGRIISQVLTSHCSYVEPIPDKTVSCWINGTRKPWGAFKVLEDENIVMHDYKKILSELTYKHLDYHISKTLAEEYGWKYSKISKVLGLDKELVRGWIKKDRGHPIAKTYVNYFIVRDELKRYLTEDELNSARDEISKTITTAPEKHPQHPTTTVDVDKLEDEQSEEPDINAELENELIYHLETLPLGVTSPKVLKSILVNCRDATVEDIQKVLSLSSQILQNRETGKWILKKFVDESSEEKQKDDLERFNCKNNNGKVNVC